MKTRPSVLGGMSAATFLSRYWQREPLVVRGAFPGLVDPLSPDELAGLACEPGIDSRLVQERGGKRPWEVVRNPSASRLRRLGTSHWTLLVESVDRHHDAVAAFAHPFSFLPRWRMDDVMVSLAPPGGTVEAHIDSYDVFLIQGQGRRRWEVDRNAPTACKPELDLRILRTFRPQNSWVLEPGDMLYVPPGVAHRGVTLESSRPIALTYSVGFRAPSSGDLLSSIASRLLAREAPSLFADPGRRAASDAHELDSRDLAALRSFLVREIPKAASDDWILAAGEAVTAGGHSGVAVRRSLAQVEFALRRGHRLRPNPAARIAWARLKGGRAALFVNGESRVFARRDAALPRVVCGHLADPAWLEAPGRRPLLQTIAAMLRAGLLQWEASTRTRRAARF